VRYAVVFEWSNTGYAAYVPDLPGCVSTGRTLEDTAQNIEEAIAGHLAVMRGHKDATPSRRPRQGISKSSMVPNHLPRTTTPVPEWAIRDYLADCDQAG
jgi:predicted RNase H-like HicB family nuclease